MKAYIFFFIFIFSTITGLHSQERSIESFNSNWMFAKGELNGAEQLNFIDSSWRVLKLPHDWAIEGPFDKAHGARCGGLPYYGNAWYRKHFDIDKGNEGKKITVGFDGIMNNSTVWINGNKIGGRPYGYIGFEVDLTPFIKYGEENVIAVKLEPKSLSARWYPGAGIYRNVRIEIKNKVNVAHWGTYITTPKVSNDNATVNIKTTIENEKNKPGKYNLETSINDALGNKVAFVVSEFEISKNNKKEISQVIKIRNPIKWDLKNPYLYSVVSTIISKETTLDTYTSSFGIRTIEFSRDNGFLLNGKKEKFKGVCLHHDLGPLGTAVNYRATERQLEIMKTMGVNAIRTSHNPPSPEQLELCDKMGILVIVEAFDGWRSEKFPNGYNNEVFDKWYDRDLRDIIHRDRNHPSVVMWSTGNEVREQLDENGGKLTKSLTNICHQEDPTRKVTNGFNYWPASIDNGLAKNVDVQGFNYKPEYYERILKNNPDWVIFGAETSSCVSSRGVYHLPVEGYRKHESLQVSSYDIISPFWGYPPDVEFEAQDKFPELIGEFVWTGFDYLGEPTPYGGSDNITKGKWSSDWPSRSSYFGIVDLCGFPKDRYYLYQSEWSEKPMVHILPHWNWENDKVDSIPVFCYTNCDEAELFLNGKSLGRKTMGVDKTNIVITSKPMRRWDSPYRLSWNVKYEPGELKVIAYNNGKEITSKVIKTASEPSKIELLADKSIINADGEDLSFITVKVTDTNGNLCPLADNLINFKITGPAIIAAVGNGNAASLESFQANYRKVFNGLCMLIIKSKSKEKGEILIEATSNNLDSKTIELIMK